MTDIGFKVFDFLMKLSYSNGMDIKQETKI